MPPKLEALLDLDSLSNFLFSTSLILVTNFMAVTLCLSWT